MHPLGIVQWDSTRRDHPGKPGGVSGSGPVTCDVTKVTYYMYPCDRCCMISEMMEMNDLD